MTKFIIKSYDNPTINQPVVIEGLPGIGNVARLCVDYLVDKLKAKKFMELFSDAFPNSVTINDDSTIKMFSIELYHARVGDNDLIFIAGDVQPTSDAESYALSEKLIEVLKSFNAKELITIGGIGLPESPDKVKVHSVFTDESFKVKLKNLGIVFDGNDTVKIILGATGLLLGIAQLNELPGFSLLAETLNHSQHVGIKEAREVLRILVKYLGIEVDFKEMNEEIKSIEDEIKEESILTDKINNELTKKQDYIG